MSSFVSLILSKNNIYYLPNSDYFQDIIKHYNLQSKNIVEVELSPPYNREDIKDINEWVFYIYRESLPNWAFKHSLESRTRNFVSKLIHDQKIAETITAGNRYCR